MPSRVSNLSTHFMHKVVIQMLILKTCKMKAGGIIAQKSKKNIMMCEKIYRAVNLIF